MNTLKKNNDRVNSLDENKLYQEEELRLKGVNIGGNQTIIRAYLISFLKGHLLLKGKQTLQNLADYLYDLDFFYVRHYNGCKRMKHKSILRELKKILNEIKKEKEKEIREKMEKKMKNKRDR